LEFKLTQKHEEVLLAVKEAFGGFLYYDLKVYRYKFASYLRPPFLSSSPPGAPLRERPPGGRRAKVFILFSPRPTISADMVGHEGGRVPPAPSRGRAGHERG